MRFRRVISLYDEDPAHRELLIHLEGIAGQHRQNHALLQMCLIGFRVMAFQESGEQAYLSVRNPDLLQFGAKQRKPAVRLPVGHDKPVLTYPAQSPVEPVRQAEQSRNAQAEPEAVQTPEVEDPGVGSPEVKSPLVSLEKRTESPPEVTLSVVPLVSVSDNTEEPAFELDEEYDTLKLLQQLGSR